MVEVCVGCFLWVKSKCEFRESHWAAERSLGHVEIAIEGLQTGRVDVSGHSQMT